MLLIEIVAGGGKARSQVLLIIRQTLPRAVLVAHDVLNFRDLLLSGTA